MNVACERLRSPLTLQFIGCKSDEACPDGGENGREEPQQLQFPRLRLLKIALALESIVFRPARPHE